MKCGKEYELEHYEKLSDFQCECDGDLVYSGNFEDSSESEPTLKCSHCGNENPDYANFCEECGENIVIQSEYENHGDNYSDEDELLMNKKGKTIKEHRDALMAKYKRKEDESVFIVQKTLDEEGYCIIKGGSAKLIKILNEGIQTESEHFFSYKEIESVTATDNKSSKKTLGLLLFTPLYFHAANFRTIQIRLKNDQQIQLDDVKKDDVHKCVGYINRRIS